MQNQNNYVTKIMDSYIPHERTKLDELRQLDKKVKLFPSVLAYILGSAAALIFGVGMCLAMQVIGASLMQPAVLMAVGVITGSAGIILCVANYFIYKAILKSRKAKYGSQIVTLSNELLNNEN